MLPDITLLYLEACEVDEAAAQITLRVQSTQTSAPCPLCTTPARRGLAAAKALTNDRWQAARRHANQIHGGVAQIKEFDLNVWYRRAAAWCMR